MTEASEPSRKSGSQRIPRGVERMRGMERAAEILGGQAVLADVLGINVRAVRAKIAAERPIRDEEIRIIARAMEAHAAKVSALAERLASLIQEQALDNG